MQKKTFPVVGMMCAGCASNVERRLRQLDGMASVAVNLPGRTALVEYDELRLSPQQMKAELQQIGYDMVVDETQSVEKIERREFTLLLYKVVMSWLIALLTMAISMEWLHVGTADVANQSMLILSLANLCYPGRGFYVSAFRQARHGLANMDTLVALSTGVAFLFSVFNTFWGEQVWGSRGLPWHTCYDASVMIITFVLTGRLLEERAKNSTASAIRTLMGMQPKTARVALGETLRQVPIATVVRGDVLEVRPGEKIPVDGLVNEAPSASADKPLVDESMISGEPVPAAKATGDKVFAGTMVKSGVLRFRAMQVGEHTVLANIIRMVQQAQGSKAPVQRVTDRVASVFVPAVVAIALLTFALWWLFGGQQHLPEAILSAVSVLVIACPCAMGLATPTALMVGIGKAAQQNMLIKDAVALESLRKVNAMVFDKTGTITQLSDRNEGQETLKPHTREATSQLRDMGVELYMMSGDREERVSRWAAEAGIDHHQSQVLPQDKEDLVRRLQREGMTVAMVGDGINDSQALAAADVSIAMGKGTDVAIDVALLTLMSQDLRLIPRAIVLSRRTVGMIHQNLFWAFVYNVVCIPLAAGLPRLFGASFHITPMWASALMAFSSVSVVLNSLRLKWTK